jgi:hypothetical protein
MLARLAPVRIGDSSGLVCVLSVRFNDACVMISHVAIRVPTKLNKNTFEQSDHLLGTACQITIRLQLGFYLSRKRSNTHAN